MRRRALRAGAALAFAGLLLLYVVGALQCVPSADFSRLDLEVLSLWLSGGSPGIPPSPAGHLVKPGYLLFVRLAFPRATVSPQGLRRLVLFNALSIAGACLAVCGVLWKRGRLTSAAALALLAGIALPFRDAADYLATEPLALAFSFSVCAVLLVRWRRPVVWGTVLGAALAVFALVRPNTSYALGALSIVVLASAPVDRARRIASLAAGFFSGFGVLALAGVLSGLSLNPFSMGSSEALLFGTARYAWPADLEPQSRAGSPQEARRLDLERARARWNDFLREAAPDRNRFLAWRTTHPVLSAEQFPSRWFSFPYRQVDTAVRRWWWVAGILWSCAAVACALGGRGDWRCVSLAALLICVGQGLAFGAEQRYALPLIPVALTGLVVTVPTVRWRSATAVGALVALVLLLCALRKSPDAASSEYALIRGPGHVIRQRIPSFRLPAGTPATLHVRILEPSGPSLGIEVSLNGRLVLRREPSDPSPPAPFLTVPLDTRTLRGPLPGGPLEMSIRTVGAVPEASESFVYYPAVPALFGGTSTVDGRSVLPAPSGGTTLGGIPFWIHAGTD